MRNALPETAALQRRALQLGDVPAPGAFERCDDSASTLIDTILRKKHEFGITRLGTITGLDRLEIPVAQVVRPLSLSNAVSQGKGRSIVQAAASALMESIETFAAERIDPTDIRTMTANELSGETVRIYHSTIAEECRSDWSNVPVQWMMGWDLLSNKSTPVPVALVDTVYTVSSPHPKFFPRTTTGLGAGRSLLEAVVHAGLEIVERDSISLARRSIGFFDDCQVDSLSLEGETASVLRALRTKDFVVGLWQAPARCKIPTYWCHLIPPDRADELAPLPAEGFASDFSDDEAILKAVLEAAQSRLSAISGAREDITRDAYPRYVDREKLSRWRYDVAHPLRTRPAPRHSERIARQEPTLGVLLDSLVRAGAQAVILVPLLCDDHDNLYVVRLVAPPLNHGS